MHFVSKAVVVRPQLILSAVEENTREEFGLAGCSLPQTVPSPSDSCSATHSRSFFRLYNISYDEGSRHSREHRIIPESMCS